MPVLFDWCDFGSHVCITYNSCPKTTIYSDHFYCCCSHLPIFVTLGGQLSKWNWQSSAKHPKVRTAWYRGTSATARPLPSIPGAVNHLRRTLELTPDVASGKRGNFSLLCHILRQKIINYMVVAVWWAWRSVEPWWFSSSQLDIVFILLIFSPKFCIFYWPCSLFVIPQCEGIHCNAVFRQLILFIATIS